MTEVGDETARSSDAVEALLEKASPRPAPPADVENDVREAVRAEWVTANGRRRRRTTWKFAAAAAMVLAVAVSLLRLQLPSEPIVSVAVVERTTGAIYVEGAGQERSQVAEAAEISSTQILLTDDNAVAGLTWRRGGSLRIAGSSRVEFLSDGEIFLHSGKIYFDSLGTGAGAPLLVQTEHGVVSHIGTQYMTETSRDTLVVSVREGVVSIAGHYHDQVAHEGQRVNVTGSARPAISNTNGAGTEWQWVEAAAPTISVDGMSAFEFLHWVGRETGRTVRFASDGAEQVARDARLRGVVNADPRTELRLRMMTVDLHATFSEDRPEIIVDD